MAVSVPPGPAGSVPPHNLEAETSVLGAILLAEQALDGILIDVKLSPEDFYRERNRLVFRSMLRLKEKAVPEPIDALTVSEELTRSGELEEAGGTAYVHSLPNLVPAAGNARHYGKIVKEHALLRRLLDTARDIQEKALAVKGQPSELVEQAEQAMYKIAHDEHASEIRSIEAVLHDELDKLEQISREGVSLIGTPSGFRDLDDITGGFQPGNLIVLAARPAMGKCLVGSSLVYDPRSGLRVRIDELVARRESGEELCVAALGSDFKLRPARVSLAARNGKKAVFRLTTRLGRRIEATANHPLLTVAGWRELRLLGPGDRIAVPRTLPAEATESMPDHKLVLLAALIADGNLTQKTPRFCFGSESPVLPEVERAAAAMGCRLRCAARSNGTATISAGRGAAANPVRELMREHGLWGKRSAEKFVPERLFTVGAAEIARFLGVLFACDGHIYASDRLRQIGYTTISEELARDVQHLLLRLGIVSCIRKLKRDVYEGTDTVAREVRITGQESLLRFIDQITVPGKGAQAERLRSGLARAPRATNVDTIPAQVWPRIQAVKGERPWSAVSGATGRPSNHNWHVGTRGLSRHLLGELAEWSGDEHLRNLATSDVWWDEVASIEPIGEAETYDIAVPEGHNFVADDVIVHNSALVVNIAENAAVDHDKAVALFSLEMSETELAQRFIASQAKLDGDELRKGRVKADRWPKVIRATEALSRTQLFIDDSSDLGVMELRAKARRLHSRHDLGLIVIDYLQLMRPEDTSVGRVEQIGQMSRGLKILARELHVPVIAVSQLSRAVESRPDKRPLLSDLRESGCLTGDARVFLPESGTYARIEDLAGRSGFKVLAVNRETWRLEPREVARAFSTGTKPVHRLRTRLGKEIRATGNHKFLTIEGWRRLDELDIGEHVAVPGFLPSQDTSSMPEVELALLGHLIGDGCTLPRHAIQYTTKERRLAELVAGLAKAVFGDSVKPRIRRERQWFQVYLPSTQRLARGKRNPIAAWLDDLGAFGHRSWEKRVPTDVFKQPADAIATFLRHLWATDGCLWLARGDDAHHASIYYSTSSERLARDVQALLLRLGITAALRKPKAARGRQQYHVAVLGGPDMRRFLQRVGGLGLERGQRAEAIGRWLDERGTNTNRDVIPRQAWTSLVKPAMARGGVTTRALQDALATSYCGSTLYKGNIGRLRAERVAAVSGSRELMQLAYSDVYWDQVVSIEPAGVEKVYDLTVDELHSFVADDIVVHNSIEQDADVVLFIYRDEYYNDDTEVPGEAEIIVSKHRNGPVGRINLAFMARYPKFANLWRDHGGDVPAGADANGSG